jgi:hypothetical protein
MALITVAHLLGDAEGREVLILFSCSYDNAMLKPVDFR